MENGARRIEVGRVISESFSMYGANMAPLLTSAFVIFLISGALQGFLNDEGGFILVTIGWIIAMIAQALYTGFVVTLVEDVRADGTRDMGAGEMLSSAQSSIPALIINSILRGIGIGIGFIFLIVPGLILLTIWSLTSPAIVIEKTGAMGAFGRSYELVRGQAWQVFGVIVVAFLIAFGVSIVAALIGAAIGLAGVIILVIIAGILTAPIPALVASILFFDLGGGGAAIAPAQPPTAPPAPPAATV